ncbi:hypothetical protein [Chengkuizengella axinellae]|uniref:PqqD family protein n=1 Tax=Chengkuizengella axinellae TaxID=3064388 RepID=A0ABT9J0Q5_9BACL|nr:hypothetical protein [Chengkuizengella sp. 2205SS18-9]MDP5274605.1 hypothetical protein [Chengkuizengella sp. 2205SS18-9]
MSEILYGLNNEEVYAENTQQGIFILTPQGETIILNDTVSNVIWKSMMKEPQSLLDLENKILQSFNITDRNMVKQDLLNFIKSLVQHNIILEH